MSLSTGSLRILEEPVRFGQSADFEEFEPKTVDADQDAVQRRLIGDPTSQHSQRRLHCDAPEVFVMIVVLCLIV